jgi:hypothetical protein
MKATATFDGEVEFDVTDMDIGGMIDEHLSYNTLFPTEHDVITLIDVKHDKTIQAFSEEVEAHLSEIRAETVVTESDFDGLVRRIKRLEDTLDTAARFIQTWLPVALWPNELSDAPEA